MNDIGSAHSGKHEVSDLMDVSLLLPRLKRQILSTGRVAKFSQQNSPNCYSKLAQWFYQVHWIYTFVWGGEVRVEKFTLQGLNFTLLGS